jgi:hypothetical protein
MNLMYQPFSGVNIPKGRVAWPSVVAVRGTRFSLSNAVLTRA